ncbi:hypothetical protein B296_00051237 [Ensete ventricosum]|uniref:Uncharacterized protein n=1 Tax=Ensete ventricosum TaxID=4639 RepID=A0A426X0Z3_ENSVE|nr:hypothetical protein B296_00051237 [Ensete ventricosum]
MSLDHEGDLAHMGDLTRLTHHPTLRHDPNTRQCRGARPSTISSAHVLLQEGRIDLLRKNQPEIEITLSHRQTTKATLRTQVTSPS